MIVDADQSEHPTSNRMVAEYARPAHQESQLTVGEYVFYFVAVSLFVLLLVLPGYLMGDLKSMYDDFKMKLPVVTQSYVGLSAFLRDSYAGAWLWIIPAIAPLGIARLPRHVRGRFLLIAVLLAGCAGASIIYVVYLPFEKLVNNLGF